VWFVHTIRTRRRLKSHGVFRTLLGFVGHAAMVNL
jgi:hypothetical protein